MENEKISVIENLFSHHNVELTEGTRKVYVNIIKLSGVSIAIAEAKTHIHTMSLLNTLTSRSYSLNHTIR